MPSIQINVPIQEHSGAWQARLEFPRSRTVFGMVTGAPAGVRVHPTRHEFWLTGPRAIAEPLVLNIEYRGETPGSPRVTTSGLEPQSAILAAARGSGLTWEQTATESAERQATLERRRRAEIVTSHFESNPEFREGRALAFFWALDEKTDLDYLADDGHSDLRERQVALLALLEARLFQRRQGTCRLGMPQKRDLEEFSKIQLDLVRHYYPRSRSENTGIDVEAFNEAFAFFAGGRLWKEGSPLYASKPDSAYFFFFAEFAFAAIEQAVDVDAWQALLPVLVYGQTTFATVFEPHCAIGGQIRRAQPGQLVFRSYSGAVPWEERMHEAIVDLFARLRSAPNDIGVLEATHVLNTVQAFPAGDSAPPNLCV